ncbi:squamous cell carcinoma antigen recognized by T-cells 3-like isoform X1 [Asterias rubens]|uniref:squamous cell carcinoma antigen recognized by T-cells 3-like isoform X1 n=1 Tax=Asterias rubens TaxID=7604 RepID=UPI001454E747|nr:squamous cell carcinoma antigen recognized by T-cells 3-like isoform X1 [Asterias rubens]
MSKYFPLTPELWLEWIQDEIDLQHLEKSKINKLFQKAVGDYTSPELWEKYCSFCLETMNTNYSISEVRSIFEQALTAVRLHVSKADIIWKLYRDFENSLRESAQNECEKDQQTARLERLFKRQLSVPLMNIRDTWSEYESMLGKPPTQISKGILAQLDKYRPYEQKLLKTTPPSSEDYRAYLDYEKASKGHPARVQCLYERAVLDHCLQEQLWLDYTDYVETKLKIKDIVLSVYDRSVRNCPWSGRLWCNYLIAKEKFRESLNVIKGKYEEILSSGVLPTAAVYLAIWQSYIDYMRGHIPELDPRTLISVISREGLRNGQL